MPKQSVEELTGQFDYDSTVSLEVKEHGLEERAGISIRDISYTSLTEGRVKAYYVQPARTGPFAGVLFVHPGPGDRTNFLEEAVKLAGQGMASLLVEAPWAQGEAWGMTMGQSEHDRQEFTQIALDLRRAVDVLTTQPKVDAARLGYVGHSFGALFGGILAGVDKRFKAYILIAGVGSFIEVMILNMPYFSFNWVSKIIFLVGKSFWLIMKQPANRNRSNGMRRIIISTSKKLAMTGLNGCLSNLS